MLALITLLVVITVQTGYCDVIFTTERCTRPEYGLQVVHGDPTRYKQCGPSNKVWIVPCAPKMTFDPLDKVCKERSTRMSLLRRTQNAKTRPDVTSTTATSAPEEFIFSTLKPRRPRIKGKGKGKLRKTTTALPPTTSMMLSSEYDTVDSDATTVITPFYPPPLETTPITIRTTHPTVTNRIEVKTTAMPPKENTLRYGGENISEGEFMSRLMNMVKAQKTANEEKERMEIKNRQRQEEESRREMERQRLEREKQEKDAEIARLREIEARRAEKLKKLEEMRVVEERRREIECMEQERREIERTKEELETKRKEVEERERAKEEEMNRKAKLLEEQRKQLEQVAKRRLEMEMAEKTAQMMENIRIQEEEKKKKTRELEESKLQEEKDRIKEAERKQIEEQERRRLEQQRLEREREEMKVMIENEEKQRGFNRYGAETTAPAQTPLFPQTKLPEEINIIRFPPRPEEKIPAAIGAVTVPPMETWGVIGGQSWKNAGQWNIIEEEIETTTMINPVYYGCMINGDCPYTYEKDQFCKHPSNPSAYLQCSPLIGRRGRWTERFCPETLIFIEELARCEKRNLPPMEFSSLGAQSAPYNPPYNPDDRVFIPRLPSEVESVEWTGNRIQTIPQMPEYPTIRPINPQQSYTTTPIYPTIIPQFTNFIDARPTTEDPNELDLQFVSPIFPRFNPSFLDHFLPFKPLRDDKDQSQTIIGSVVKPVLKKIALSQTSNFIDRLLSDETRVNDIGTDKHFKAEGNIKG